MIEDIEEHVDITEEKVDDEEEFAEDDLEIIDTDAETFGNDNVNEASLTDVTPSYILSLFGWYSKLLQLRDALKRDLESSNGIEKELVNHELSEVEKEIGYVLWRIYEGLKTYRSTCNKQCGECPLEVVCKKFSQLSAPPRRKGSSEPWLIPILLKRYLIE
ncbi:hypothetical protein EYM_03825 [Ignicoccus islandicus DSM 13165]|uniref:Uncharacterized protein n=1 Tax=Ignicoccus islandicus DSM 13165 TaxID=940295 RepID=A0A0U2MAX9_9CREN|nr:hypothetical protein [Ignicoccus islandicus]ALU12445.1 hypothetical protein EYM_03825 [Ignicoccus islandicus DSM 13165]